MKTKTANFILGFLFLLAVVGTWSSVFVAWSNGSSLFQLHDVAAQIFAVSALVVATLGCLLQCCSKKDFKKMVGCLFCIGIFALIAIIVFAVAIKGEPLGPGFYIMMTIAIVFCCCPCCLATAEVDDLGDLRKLLASADPAAVQAALNAVLMQAGGFQMCTSAVSSALNQTLRSVRCEGGTALYDAVAQGTLHILKLQSILLELGVRQQKFVHVIVTDGEDTHSKLSLAECCGLMGQIAPLSQVVETVFIAVGLSSNSAGYQALRRLANAGGSACRVVDAESANIGDVFQRISATISRTVEVNVVGGHSGMNNKGVISNRAPLLEATQTTAVELNVNFFAVFLDLDMSGSMSGGRWNSLTSGVNHLLQNLTPLDAVGCVLFNTTPNLITRAA